MAGSPQINKAENAFYTVYPLSISHPWIPCQPEFIHLLFQAGEGRLHPHQMQRTERSKFSEVGITFDTHMGAIGKGASPHRRIVSWGNFVKAIHLN